MGLNCALHVSTERMSMIHALAAWPSIFRGNCLKNHPDFNPFSVSR